MAKLKLKSGDSVIVTAGDHKGMEGTVLRVFLEKNKAIVEGVNLVKKHEKPTRPILRVELPKKKLLFIFQTFL